ncbi:MAG TPA: RidA family protein [Terriglobia bacterium]|nr:RidA family protein [Terriglobia bacterium]
MPKEHINPDSLFPSVPHAFSQVIATHGGKTIYISGQTAWDAEKRLVGGNSLVEQARQALRNVEAAGSLADVVALRLYVVNYRPADASLLGTALREFFPGVQPPTSTWIGVSSLAVADFLIEIEAVAVVE